MAINERDRKRGGERQAVSDINITPLVDVLLVLLIIFMVTSPIVYQSIDVPTPENSLDEAKNDAQEVQKGTLTITKTGQIILKNQTIPENKLLNFVKKDPELQKKKELFIKADADLSYGVVMKVMGILRKAGISKLGLIVEDSDLIPETTTPSK